jgi:hypothetical protein
MIAEHGATVEVPVPEYDWKRQQRWDANSPVGGKYTGNSVQTFDSQGKPNDSRSDSND